MEGTLTAIVGFIFVCMVMPQIIRNRHQFTLAIVAVLLMLLLKIVAFLGHGSAGFLTFITVVMMVLEMLAFLLLVLSAGGLSPQQLAGDMARAYEVMRRGETEKTVIIPLSGQAARPRSPAGGKHDEPEERTVFTINDADLPGAPDLSKRNPPPPPAPPASPGGSIPLE